MLRPLILLALFLVFPRFATAETCPVPDGAAPALAGLDAGLRRGFIERTITSEADSAGTWLIGWAIGHGALVAGSLALIPLDDRSARPDHIVGASAAGVGLLTTQLGRHGALRARRELAEPPRATPCAELARVEETFLGLAEGDRMRTAWYMHAVNVTFNVGMGLILGLGYDRWGPAAVQMAAGSAVGEALILTRPTSSIGALERYRAGELAAREESRLRPVFVATPSALLVGAATTF